MYYQYITKQQQKTEEETENNKWTVKQVKQDVPNCIALYFTC